MKTGFISLIIFVPLAACISSQAAPQSTIPQPALVFTAIPTLTPPPPTPTYGVAPLDDAENIVYYFAPDMCNAKWVNNGQELPCPGTNGQIGSGYVGFLTESDLGLNYKANALLTIPSQNHDFYAIFGIFPAQKIEFADFFRAQLYCMPKNKCDVTFSLGYMDESGKLIEPFPAWSYNYTELPRLINFPLDILAGKTVQLTLIVRDNGDPAEDFAVWVEPRIFRHPDIFTPTPQP